EDGIRARNVTGVQTCALPIFDAAAIPDLVPILAVLAAVAEGKTRIYHAQRLRLKESDRLAAVASLLKNLGGAVEITADGLLIQRSEERREGKAVASQRGQSQH